MLWLTGQLRWTRSQQKIQDSDYFQCYQALVELIDTEDLARRATFPENVEIREIGAHLAANVFEQAVQENLKVFLPIVRLSIAYRELFQIGNKVMLESYQHGGYPELKAYIYSKMWYPNYRPLVHLPPGKEEWVNGRYFYN